MKKDQDSFPTNNWWKWIESVAVTQTGENVLAEPGNDLFLEKEGRALRTEEGDTRPRSRLASLCIVFRLTAAIFLLQRGKESCSLSLQRAAYGDCIMLIRVLGKLWIIILLLQLTEPLFQTAHMKILSKVKSTPPTQNRDWCLKL